MMIARSWVHGLLLTGAAMKRLLVCLLLVGVVGCGGGPNQKANTLFEETFQLIELADGHLNVSDDEAVKYYEKALSKVQRIIDDYPNSDLAVKLISGEALFTAGTVADVKQELALAKERVDKERREEQGTRN